MRRWLDMNAGSLRVMCVLVRYMPESFAVFIAIKWGDTIDWTCSLLEHNLNSMHVMCRLSKIMPLPRAKELAMKWEKKVHPYLYW